MELINVPVGGEFEVWNRKFIKLDTWSNIQRGGRSCFVIAAKPVRYMPFSTLDHESPLPRNNFSYSTVYIFLSNQYLAELTSEGMSLTGDMTRFDVDLESPVQREYGYERCYAGLLTLRQFGTYRRLIPNRYEDSWWLATPWKTPEDADGVFDISTSTVYAVGERGFIPRHVSRELGVRPTMLLRPSLLVSVDGDSQNGNTDSESQTGDSNYQDNLVLDLYRSLTTREEI